ncbi:hypothetical protein 9F2_34 [uncultured Caudovirales phage]|uniref:Uncharacterized protein n=1 Tax=uncultured Caudovirales phage TaxID=2100421 RepID=A0A2H4J8G0_9CAUD|nr:hypothetical protein 9F2_34 [uncultured Caudovirales phage]
MNMKQSCKALICAIEGELDGRHCTEEQASAILDHALPSLTEALALAEAERDRYKLAWMEFMDRTDWMQEKGQVPAKYLGQHRADVLTAMLNEARAALATQPAVGVPVPYIVGNQYRTQAGDLVRFVAVKNGGTDYECMEDEHGVHRYTSRDHGRVTGSPHDYSHPGNTPPLYSAPPAAAPVAAGEQAPIGYANPKHLASMAAGTRAIVPILPSICPGLHHTEPVYAVPPDAAHGDEAVLTFEYVGPRNERKTVEVTREEVADHLDYMLFEKLTAAVCGCDPAESDDCRCDEYAEQFTMRVQAGEGGE